LMGSELVALLYESHEIKHHHPSINRAQRARNPQYVIHISQNEAGYFRLQSTRANLKQKKEMEVLGEYHNQKSALGTLNRMVEAFDLCRHLSGLDNTGTPCFHYHIEKCRGACIGKETPDAYNERLMEALEYLAIDFPENFMLIDDGRNAEEKSVVLVEDGQYQGFGYFSTEDDYQDLETLREVITPYAHNRDVTRIIRGFINKGDVKVVKF